MKTPLRLACLVSGGGRTMMNIADQIDQGTLSASIELVIASRSSVPGVERAQSRGFKTLVVRQRDFQSSDAMHDEITKQLLEHRIDLVCLCGYLRPVRIDEPLRWRVMNIHPALLPEFGGKGMYGERVHRAVLAARRTKSGCTVHFVDEHYDMGPIILQRTVPVFPGDDKHTLAARVFEQECIAYPQAISLFGEGRLKLENGQVRILERSPT
ncbi:MAG: phosphoribosylglycinamide formyltransferase [Phycisphaerales bacterium]|nr:phosphoribosylglycinamide formyltransferase [Phycisphaerales bacterium]MCI0631026.1 phosphoribosylglycinamide formyltransferase [Phycisphaerales bacterium]MCI0676231.1 phosphoribosylglycinamide formyltransferase [Phycisphaerales bacterium]